MLPETATMLKVRMPGLLKALKTSYHVTATASQVQRAAKLAASVEAFRPGIYRVGACIVDLWRNSCSCKASRLNKCSGITPQVKPCPHFLALYLRGEWNPLDADPIRYLKNAGVDEPEIIRWYAHIKGKHGDFQLNHTHTDSATGQRFFSVTRLSDGRGWYEPVDNITHFLPFYGE